LIIAGTALLNHPPKAQARPSYARQTGQQRTARHNDFPELTPYGQAVQIDGYTFGGGQSDYGGPHFWPWRNVNLGVQCIY
jgi:hypothetical protein